MQSLEQEIDRSEQSLTSHDHPALRGLLADQATAHADEVRLLRQRVATLEEALASAKASAIVESPVKRAAPHFTTDAPPCRTEFVSSEFSESMAPAVVAMTREDLTSASTATHPATSSAVPAENPAENTLETPIYDGEAEVFSDQGFADAWTDDAESSFEERLAEKAFFQAGSVDEQSRNWLLTS